MDIDQTRAGKEKRGINLTATLSVRVLIANLAHTHISLFAHLEEQRTLYFCVCMWNSERNAVNILQ